VWWTDRATLPSINMLPRWVTYAYLAHLIAPIDLLVVGSSGGNWLNTLLPSGFAFQWNRDAALDASFRRAFNASLAAAAATCTACLVIGVPLAYAVFRTDRPGVRAFARLLYQLPVALPPLVLAFGFILVSSDTGTDLPAAAALSVLITAACSIIMTLGEWASGSGERHL
jgi:ABC-type spermidine/putrescine transport system permease subunit II